MCLGIPAKVIEIEKDNTGKVDYLGTKIKANFSLLSDVEIGDYVILHAGFAISKLNQQEAEETFSLLREIANINPNDKIPNSESQ
ncbi:MAG: HypC/HybG/HupF family hydrogenase formation chaperone [Candidatus Aminicenantia bacterium]